jgi:glycosyltransferase involved in cell wall biosynthesis
VGGAERSIQFLSEALVGSGHEVTIVCTTPGGEVNFNVVNGVRVYYIGLKNIYWPYGTNERKYLKALWHLLDTYNPFMGTIFGRILDIENPLLVHTNNLSGFSISLWNQVKDRNLPLLHTLRDYYLLCPKSTMFRRGGNCQSQCPECRVLSYPRKAKSHAVDMVVGISKSILSKHLTLGYFNRDSKRSVIYNPYVINEGLNKAVSRENHDKFRVGYLGRLHPSKGIELLLDQLPHASELWVGGRGSYEYEARLRRKCDGKNIVFCGYVSPSKFLPNIDALVVPSLWNDPHNRSVIEAYAYGIPVIGSCMGGIPEIVVDGQTGFLFDPYQEGSLKKALYRFLDSPDLSVKMKGACLKKAKEFSPTIVADRYLEAYKVIAQ